MNNTMRLATVFFIVGLSLIGPAQTTDVEAPSRLRQVIENYDQDRGAFGRWYSAETSPARRNRFKRLFEQRLADLARLDFDKLEHHEKVDYLLFQNHLRRELQELDRNAVQLAEMEAIIPFAQTISDLEDQRRRLAAKIHARHPGPGKRPAPAECHLAFRDAQRGWPDRLHQLAQRVK